MTNFKAAVIHGAKVAGHIAFAAIIIGLGVLIDNNSQVTQQFVSYLIQFGIPTAIANIVVAAVVKFIKLRAAQLNAENSNTPPAV